MKRIFYIFLSPNDKPDLYVNIITYWVLRYNYSDFEKIELLRIAESPVKKNETILSVSITRDNIETQLRALTLGKYMTWDNKIGDKGGFAIDFVDVKVSDKFSHAYRDAYQMFLRDLVKCSVLLSEDIEEHLENLIKDKSHKYIFDVTGLKNRQLIKVALYLFAEKCESYSFEILKYMKHNEADLIHNLEEKKDYDYFYFEKPKGIEIIMI